MSVTRVLGAILKSLVRAVLLSAIMFVITYSIITHRFPPDFSNLTAAYQRLQDYKQTASEVRAQGSGRIITTEMTMQDPSLKDEADIDQLTELYEKRAAVATKFMGMQEQLARHPAAARAAAQALGISTGEKAGKIPSGPTPEQKEIAQLKAHVLTLEDHVQSLEKQILKLQSQTTLRKPH